MKENSVSQSPFLSILGEKLADSLAALPPPGTPRVVSEPITIPRKATVIVGMRRAGKTTFLHQIRSARHAAGQPVTRLPYINFEDERLAGIDVSYLAPLLDLYYRQFPDARSTGVVTWCFDEIQTVPGWERFIRRMLDNERVELFLTGSSAALLSREIATSMRGRAWEVAIHPFAFDEALHHSGVDVPNDASTMTAAARSRLEHAFIEYLRAGGFPEVQGHDESTRRRMLTDYVDVAILRDVVERHGVTNIVGLRWLVRQLLSNAGGKFSVEKFHATLKSLGITISRDTVHQLLAHLQDCFLVRTVWIEAESERKRMVNPRKSYPIDSGLIPLFDRTRRANIGHALETMVLIELERRRCDVTYLRTEDGYEVDFFVRMPSGERELIQVCADASSHETAEREIRAMQSAANQYPDAQCRLLTLTMSGLLTQQHDGIIAEPAYAWMLRR